MTRRVLRCALAALLVPVLIVLYGCAAFSGASDDSKEIYDGDVALIMEKTGVDSACAAEIYRILRDSGLDTRLSFITKWTDFDIGSKYYRVTANGVRRDVYLTDDGKVAMIKDGGTICYKDPSAVLTPTVTETGTAPETDAARETDAPSETEPPATSAPETTHGATDEVITYVLNTNTKKFHKPSCSHVGTIKESNRAEYTGTREDLITEGYSPCGTCKP